MSHIVINGRRIRFNRDTISYRDVSRFAGIDPDLEPTIVFSGGATSGELHPGEVVDCAEGMTFTAAVTGQA